MKPIPTIGIAVAAVITAVAGYDRLSSFGLFGLVGWGVPQTLAQGNPPTRSPASQPPAASSAPAPSAAVRTESTVYDSWTVTCSETMEKPAKKTCSAMLQFIEEKQRQVMLMWAIGRDPQGVLRSVIQCPTGVQIPKGLELKFGNRPARMLRYTVCTPQHCEATTVMDDAMVRDATASEEALATIVAADGRTINFKIGMKGVDQAFIALGK